MGFFDFIMDGDPLSWRLWVHWLEWSPYFGAGRYPKVYDVCLMLMCGRTLCYFQSFGLHTNAPDLSDNIKRLILYFYLIIILLRVSRSGSAYMRVHHVFPNTLTRYGSFVICLFLELWPAGSQSFIALYFMTEAGLYIYHLRKCCYF